MRTRRRDPTDQIEHQERDAPELVFDVVAEDPEEQHVAEDVQDRAVQEHGEHDPEPHVLVGEDLVGGGGGSGAALLRLI